MEKHSMKKSAVVRRKPPSKLAESQSLTTEGLMMGRMTEREAMQRVTKLVMKLNSSKQTQT